jgi:hypothetical protein
MNKFAMNCAILLLRIFTNAPSILPIIYGDHFSFQSGDLWIRKLRFAITLFETPQNGGDRMAL